MLNSKQDLQSLRRDEGSKLLHLDQKLQQEIYQIWANDLEGVLNSDEVTLIR
jgi:hypothetical protein